MIETAVLLMCLKIFCFRILDVSLSTVRMVLTIKEKTKTAAMVGFVEVFIWFTVVRDALNSTGPFLPTAIAYAGGFATGTYVGGKLAKKFIKGQVTASVVTSGQNNALVIALREAGYAVTVMNVNSSEFSAEKYMLLVNIDKGRLRDFQKLVDELDPGAFILVQETKNVINGYNRK